MSKKDDRVIESGLENWIKREFRKPEYKDSQATAGIVYEKKLAFTAGEVRKLSTSAGFFIKGWGTSDQGIRFCAGSVTGEADIELISNFRSILRMCGRNSAYLRPVTPSHIRPLSTKDDNISSFI